jgi:hypothetical protein
LLATRCISQEAGCGKSRFEEGFGVTVILADAGVAALSEAHSQEWLCHRNFSTAGLVAQGADT